MTYTGIFLILSWGNCWKVGYVHVYNLCLCFLFPQEVLEIPLLFHLQTLIFFRLLNFSKSSRYKIASFSAFPWLTGSVFKKVYLLFWFHLYFMPLPLFLYCVVCLFLLTCRSFKQYILEYQSLVPHISCNFLLPVSFLLYFWWLNM